MGSSSSWGGSRSYGHDYEAYRSPSKGDRDLVSKRHAEEIKSLREVVSKGEVPKVEAFKPRDEKKVLEPSMARNKITNPSPQAKRVILALIDNSGSNRTCAAHMRKSSGHFTSFLQSIDPEAEIAFVYFSDHSDRHLESQEIDFIQPSEAGDKILCSSADQIIPANGGDFPEAIECALKGACEVNFAHVKKEDRTLILMTDSIPHGMAGYQERDNGCPHQISWRSSMKSVRETFGSFVLIGSGCDPEIATFQKTMFSVGAESDSKMDLDAALNFIDLSSIQDSIHRNGLVANALLFVIARMNGKQAMQVFLPMLYRKWLSSPLFGGQTDQMAKNRIMDFGPYLRGVMTDTEILDLMKESLVLTDAETQQNRKRILGI